ncbi:MAG TPA: DUF2551 domain-containing protein [Methanocorpusculum sp.]|nr:DUF2551 domain-containing protein [Methanocorpusculum sp.]
MFTASDFKAEIEKRATAYLSRDKSGIRKAVLEFLLKLQSVTVQQVYSFLVQKFNVTLKSVASMLGIIAAKLGLLSVRRERDGDLGVYELKPQYVALVTRLVTTN